MFGHHSIGAFVYPGWRVERDEHLDRWLFDWADGRRGRSERGHTEARLAGGRRRPWRWGERLAGYFNQRFRHARRLRRLLRDFRLGDEDFLAYVPNQQFVSQYRRQLGRLRRHFGWASGNGGRNGAPEPINKSWGRIRQYQPGALLAGSTGAYSIS